MLSIQLLFNTCQKKFLSNKLIYEKDKARTLELEKERKNMGEGIMEVK